MVLEKRAILGGSCVTEEIHPGHRVSTISYIVRLLRDEKDLLPLAKLELDVKKLSPDRRHCLIQIFTSSAYDIIERWFESPMIKNMYLAACFSGNFASLRQPGSALPFFSMAVGELEGELGAWRLVKGGMGGIVEAMASFARSKGVDIRTDSPVEEIIVNNGKAVGVKKKDGETVISV